MTTPLAVELAGAGKRFTKYLDTPMLVNTALRFRPQTRRQRLWAVRDVDFAVADGESVGVIGRNGSGKSTLMSMIAGITAPTEGSVRVWGRVAPLIAVGVGFHRELTGRENVYVNGAILGLTRRQIDQRLDTIIDFAEIGDFVDTPVKFYSSGMFVRLGFAVAAHCDPDVLIVDEVLAVGDLAFQVKCYERMTEIRRQGATVVMVSHHLGAVRRMCDRVLVLDGGRARHVGPPEEAIAAYHDILSASQQVEVDDAGLRFEPGVVTIDAVDVVGPDGTRTGHLEAGAPMAVWVRGTALRGVDDLVVALTILAADGTVVYGDSTAGQRFGSVETGEAFGCTAELRCALPTGSYSVVARIDRADLRTTLATHPQQAFFVTGRHTVTGAADLGSRFRRQQLSRHLPSAAGAGVPGHLPSAADAGAPGPLEAATSEQVG